MQSEAVFDPQRLAIGRMVNVASRTWPGINEPGGVGRIIDVHTPCDSSEISHVDVLYVVLCKREKRVPVQYVALAPEYETTVECNGRLRDRNRLKGRCSRCGSLRIDCGSCDWIDEMGQQPNEKVVSLNENIEHEEETSSDDEALKCKIQQTYRNFRSLQRRWGRRPLFGYRDIDNSGKERASKVGHPDELLFSEDGNEEDNDGDEEDDDELLDALARCNSNYSLLKSRWCRRFGDRDTRNEFYNTHQSPASANDDDIALVDLARKIRSNMNQKGQFVTSTRPSVTERNEIHRNDKKEASCTSSQKRTGRLPLQSKDQIENCLGHEGILHERNKTPRNHRYDVAHVDETRLKDVGIVEDIGETESAYEHDSTKQSISSLGNNEPDFQSLSPFPVGALLTSHENFNDDLLPLGEFIQPEGEEAVQNLPTDTTDLSRHIAFTDLPKFFDELLAKIENEMLPDAKLEVAYFEKEIIEAGDSLGEKEGKCRELYNILRDRLLRDGTDQCRLVLSRLDDSKRYRLHCKRMRAEERKRFRGLEMELRDMRLEALDADVGRLMKRVRDLIAVHRNSSVNETRIDDDDESIGCSSSPNGEYETQDLLANNSVEVPALSKAQQVLLEPHPNATRVRTRQVDLLPSRKAKEGRQQRDVIGLQSLSTTHNYQTGTVRRRLRVEDSSDQSSTDEVHSNKERAGSSKILRRSRPHGQKNYRVSKQEPTSSSAEKLTLVSHAITCKQNDARLQESMKGGIVESTKRPRVFLAEYAARTEFLTDENQPRLPDEGGNHTETKRLRIESNGSSCISEAALLEPAKYSLSELCESLLKEYPESHRRSTQILDEIQCRLDGSVQRDVSSVFCTILQLLLLHGKATLQQLVSTQSGHLGLHIKLLVWSLSLLKKGLSVNLNPADGVAYQVFGKCGAQRFIEMVLLQLVDVIYGVVRPEAWGRVELNEESTLKAIAPLRDIIAQLLPLVESVSQCIMYKMELQQWWSSDDSKVWVSSINPASWRTLLETGSVPEGRREIRFACFRGNLPRVEIEALWKLLLYCTETRSMADNDSHARWELLSALLSRGAGVFAEGENHAETYLPSNEQLTCCAGELNTLSELLRTGALDDLPGSDTFVSRAIEKSFALQAAASAMQISSAATDFAPSFLKPLFREVRIFWNATHLRNRKDVQFTPTSTSDLIQHFEPSTISIATLLPSNSIVTNCVRLLGYWMERVPTKRARWLRLLRAVETLLRKFLALSGRFDNCGHVTEPNSINGSRASLLVYGEGAAFFMILSSAICRLRGASTIFEKGQRKSPNESIIRSVWRSVADDELRRKQDRIMTGSCEALSATYTGRVLNLCVASRAMALQSFMHLGVPFWKFSTEFANGQHSPDIYNGVVEEDNSLLFLFSCLLASLDCLCDLLAQQPTISFSSDGSVSTPNLVILMSQVCWQMGVFLVHIGNLMTPTSLGLIGTQLESAIAIFATSFFPMSSPIIIRGLESLARIAIGGNEVDACFRSCLAVLRACIRILAEVKNVAFVPTIKCPIQIGEQDEDFFGGIDDSALACIDLEGSRNSEPAGKVLDLAENALHSVVDALVRLLGSGKPSNRYMILQRNQNGNSFAPSVQGRLLVSRQLGGMCSCIAAVSAVAAVDKESFCRIIMKIPHFGESPVSGNDHDNSLWESHLAQCLSAEIVCLGKDFPFSQKLVKENLSPLLFNLIQALLDAATLERFPSCNLARIRTNGGLDCYKRERRDFLLLNSSNEIGVPVDAPEISIKKRKDEEYDTPGAAYNGRHVWNFSRKLGETILLTEDSSGIRNLGPALLSADFDLNGDIPVFFIGLSLESECMRRVQLLRTVVSATASNLSTQSLDFDFRKTSLLVVSASFSQLLRVTQGFSYLDRANHSEEHDIQQNWKPKLLELLTCYAELVITLLSWILRENAAAVQAMADNELSFFHEFLTQFLSDGCFDACQSLHDVVRFANGGNRKWAHSSLPKIRLQSAECLQGCVRRAILRRGKEFMAHIAIQNHQGSWSSVSDLFRAFLSAGITEPVQTAGFEAKQIVAIIRSSFEPVGSYSSATQRDSIHSPLEGAIDEYMDIVNLNRQNKTRALEALWRLKYEKAIRDFLLPRIERANLDSAKKKLSIQLLSHLLQFRSECVPSCTLQASLVCSILKCLWRCLRLSIEKDADNDIVSLVFSGARGLLTLPLLSLAEGNHASGAHNLITWSHLMWRSTACKELGSFVLQERQACYVWSFCTLLKEVGQLILDSNEATDAKVHLLGVSAIHTTVQSDRNNPDFDSVSKSITNFLRYEKILFPEKEIERTVINVYARRVSQSTSTKTNLGTERDGLPLWKPNTITRRKIKEFLAEVICSL